MSDQKKTSALLEQYYSILTAIETNKVTIDTTLLEIELELVIQNKFHLISKIAEYNQIMLNQFYQMSEADELEVDLDPNIEKVTNILLSELEINADNLDNSEKQKLTNDAKEYDLSKKLSNAKTCEAAYTVSKFIDRLDDVGYMINECFRQNTGHNMSDYINIDPSLTYSIKTSLALLSGATTGFLCKNPLQAVDAALKTGVPYIKNYVDDNVYIDLGIKALVTALPLFMSANPYIAGAYLFAQAASAGADYLLGSENYISESIEAASYIAETVVGLTTGNAITKGLTIISLSADFDKGYISGKFNDIYSNFLNTEIDLNSTDISYTADL